MRQVLQPSTSSPRSRCRAASPPQPTGPSVRRPATARSSPAARAGGAPSRSSYWATSARPEGAARPGSCRPCSTLNSWGSSSSENRRSHRPGRVMRGSSLSLSKNTPARSPARRAAQRAGLSASCTMVRNFQAAGRACRHARCAPGGRGSGRRRVARSASAAKRKTGARGDDQQCREPTTSKTRFALLRRACAARGFSRWMKGTPPTGRILTRSRATSVTLGATTTAYRVLLQVPGDRAAARPLDSHGCLRRRTRRSAPGHRASRRPASAAAPRIRTPPPGPWHLVAAWGERADDQR